MPVVDINGTAVQFPDDMAGDALNAAVATAARQMGPMGIARQIAGNVAGAAARGVSNLIGLPGDIAQGIDQGAQWLARQAGIDAKPLQAPPGYEWLPNLSNGVTGDMVRGGMRAAGVPVDQRAESAGGRIVQDAIEGATSSPFGAASAAYGALSGAGGGTAAEAARGLGAGETGQTVARVAGAVATPLVAGRVASALSRPASMAPTADDLKNQSHAAYTAAKDAGVVVDPARFQTFADDLAAGLRPEGYSPALHTKAAAALKEISDAAAAGRGVDLQEFDILRRIAGSAAKSIEPDERRVATLIIDKMDEWLNGLKPADLVQGGANSERAVASLNEARGLWGRARRGEVIEDLIERAQLRASQFSGSGLENSLRTEFRQLAMSPKRMRGFSDEERAAIEAVSKGTPVANTLRMLGKLAPTGVVSGALGGGMGAMVAGPAGAVGVPLVGMAARGAATRMTMNAAERAGEVARAGGALPETTARAIAEAVALLAAERGTMQLLPPGGATSPAPAR